MFRFTLRAATRRHPPSQLTRPLGRRGYASLQERAAHSSDRPWQLAAIGVTVPGLLYLRKGGTGAPKSAHTATTGSRSSTSSHGEEAQLSSKAVEMAQQAAAKIETQFVGPPPPPPEAMEPEEAVAESYAGSGSGGSSGAATPSSGAASEQGVSAEQSRGE